MQQVQRIRGSYLFKEDENATHVYIVQRGEFKITKNVYHKKPDLVTEVDRIFANPRLANKHHS